MKRLACRYAIVRFLPYQETGEFANAGVVLACPETGYFGFKLQTRRSGRVTGFFDEIDSGTFRHALKILHDELSRMQRQIVSSQAKGDSLRAVFDALIHPREAIICFGDSRSRMVEEPSSELDYLYRHYVEREFVTPAYKEQVLVKRLRTLVQNLRLIRPFRAMEIGDELTHVQFPLVQTLENGTISKAIKPFYLDQSDPHRIISHGGAWVDRVQRLRKRRQLPEAVLFAVSGPTEGDVKRCEAFEEICDDLRRLDVRVVPTIDEKGIISFATS